MQRFWVRYVILIGILVFSSGILMWAQFKQSKQMPLVDISQIPLNIGEWKGEEIVVDRQTKDILETEAVLMRNYINANNEKILLSIVYYKDSRVALHLPESCLMGQGSRLADRRLEKIEISFNNVFSSNSILTKSDRGNNLVIYFYETGNLMTSSYFTFRKQILLNKLNGKGTTGALVRFSINITDENKQDKLKVIQKFIKEIGQLLPKYLI